MSSVVLSGDTSGAITLSAPSVAGTNTITLPASTGTVLTTGSPQSGGVIQVVSVNYNSSAPSTTSTTYVTSGLAASITPKFSTSKILILVSTMMTNTSVSAATNATIYRGATNLGGNVNSALTATQNTGIGYVWVPASINYLDSPATTSSTTYTLYFLTTSGGTAYILWGAATSTITLMEIAA